MQIVAPAASVASRPAPALRGLYSLQQALDRLLGDAALQYRLIGDGTLVLSPRDTPSLRSMPPVLARDRCEGAACGEPQAAGDVPVQLQTISVFGAGEVRAANALLEPRFSNQVAGFAPQSFLNLLPGVDTQTTDPYGLYEFGTSVRIRGFAADQLAITLDGVPLEETADTRDDTPPNRYIDSENLERLQVAQGSADVDTPSFHALGGSLRYRSSDPLGVWHHNSSVSVGSDQARRVFARVDSAPLWSDGPIAMLSGSRLHAVQAQNPLATMSSHRAQFKAVQAFDTGRVTFGWLYGDRDDHDVGSYNFDGSANLVYAQRLSGDPARDARYYEYWRNGRTDHLLTLGTEWQLAPDTSLQLQPYIEFKRGYGIAGVTPEAASTAYGQALAGNPDRRDVQPPDDDRPSGRRESLSGERRGLTLNLQKGFGARHQLSLGGWLQHYDFSQRRPLYRMGADGQLYDDQPAVTLFYDRHVETQVYQLYAKDSIRLIDNLLTLQIGSKSLYVDRVASGYLNNAAFNAEQQQQRSKTDRDYLQPQIGLTWTIAAGREVFANYAENFSATPRLAFVSSSFNDHLKPETSSNIDLGLRITSDRSAVTLSMYHIDYRDRVLGLQLTDPDLVGVDTYDNVGAIRTLGMEAALYWNPMPRWRIGSTLSLNQSRFDTDYQSSDQQRGVYRVDSAGRNVPATPLRMMTVDLSWRHASTFAGADFKYTGPRYGDTLNQERVGGYALVNLNAGHSIDSRYGPRLSVQANLYNLLDRRYFGTIVPGEDRAVYNIGIGRSVYLMLGLSY